MKFRLVILLAFIYANLNAQKPIITIKKTDDTIGTNFLTAEKIKASSYIFPEKIYSLEIDTISGLAMVHTRGGKEGQVGNF